MQKNGLWFAVLALCLMAHQPAAVAAGQPELQAAFKAGMKAKAQAKPNLSKPYRPALDPRSWRKAVVGPLTQLMVLGAPHLGQLPPGLQAVYLEPLLTKLVAFAPDVITYEGLSGEECEVLQRHVQTYPNMFKDYCIDTADAARAVGLDLVSARVEIAQTLKVLAAEPATIPPTAVQRRRLAALFMAEGDRPSAVVQWMQLPAEERVARDGVEPTFLPLLNRTTGRFNENFDVAAIVAARLGHHRIYAVDNHTADSIQAQAGEGFDAALQQHWKTANNPNDPVLKQYTQDTAKLTSGAAMLSYFRFINEPRTQMTFIKTDYLKSLQDKSPQRYGRQYVAWWETRNLRMVASIRAAFGNKPGAKVLNIVGASHKPYYEAYLDLMHEVQLVDALLVLR